MDTSKLQEGMIINNYKEFCSLIEEPVKSNSKNRKSQMEQWKNYFCFKSIPNTNKYKILQVYENPTFLASSRNLYITYIETILLQYLITQQGCTTSLSKMEAFKLLGMVNENYGNAVEERKLIELVTDDLDDGYLYLDHFKTTAYQRFNDIFSSALDSLVNRKIIQYQKEMHLVTKDGTDFVASDEQMANVLNIEYQVLHELGFEFIQQVFISGKRNHYYNRIGTLLYQQYGYDRYYNAIKINYVHANMINLLEKNKLTLLKKGLNQLTTNAIKQTMHNKLVKHEKEQKFSKYFPTNYDQVNEVLAAGLLSYLFDGEKEEL